MAVSNQKLNLSYANGTVLFTYNNSVYGDPNNFLYDQATQRLGLRAFGQTPVSPFQIGGSYTLGSPAGSITATMVTNYGEYYFDSGYTHNYRIYAYRYEFGAYTFSSGYGEATLYDGGLLYQNYYINVTWDAVPDAHGYLVFKADDVNNFTFGPESWNGCFTTNTYLNDGDIIESAGADDPNNLFQLNPPMYPRDGSPALQFTENGQLAIRAQNPIATLDVRGSAYLSGAFENIFNFATPQNNRFFRMNASGLVGVNCDPGTCLEVGHIYHSAIPALRVHSDQTLGEALYHTNTIETCPYGSDQILFSVDYLGRVVLNPTFDVGVGPGVIDNSLVVSCRGTTIPAASFMGLNGQSGELVRISNYLNTTLSCFDAKGNLSLGRSGSSTAKLHLGAGSATASTAPIKLTSGTFLTSPEPGTIEFFSDALTFTTTTGPQRRGIVMNNATFTSGRIPFATTGGFLTDDADLTFSGGDTLNATKVATRLLTVTGLSDVVQTTIKGYSTQTSNYWEILDGSNNRKVAIDQYGGMYGSAQDAVAKWYIGRLLSPNDQNFGGLWFKNVATPSASNYAFLSDGNNTFFNSTTAGWFRISNATVLQYSSSRFLYSEGINVDFGATTGTKFGLATTSKMSFWNATPIVQPANTVAIDTLLVNTGLRATGGVALFDTDIKAGVVGKGIYIKEGTNATLGGSAVLVGGTVVVSTTKVTASSRIFLTCQTSGGTVGAVYVSARTAGTSFTITSTSGTDTSTIAWLIIEPA